MKGIKSKKLIVILLALIALLAIIISQVPSEPVNILPLMRDGMQNETTRLLYAEDIHDVMTISNSKWIDIWYYDYDLNGDGHMDKIAYVQSPFHCGSGGCSFQIWVNNGNGDFVIASMLTVQLLTFEGYFHPDCRVVISRSKTNGFYDIEFSGPYNNFALKYDGERYRWHSLEKTCI